MASIPPPFEVEDQTDEDFFDKLVDDDDDDDLAPQLNHSDHTKPLANLTIADRVTENSAGQELQNEKLDSDPDPDPNPDNSTSLLSANAAVLDALPESESNQAPAGSESVIDSKSSQSSTSSGFKVVGWSSFHADAPQNGGTHGFGSYSDFFSELDGDATGEFPGNGGENSTIEAKTVSAMVEQSTNGLNGVVNHTRYPDSQDYLAPAEQSTNGQDLNSIEYWESFYPGWKYDTNTGQWYEVDGFDPTANTQGGFSMSTPNDDGAVSEVTTEVSYMQQTSHYFVGTATETSTSLSVSNWNQLSQVNNGYPEHMVFDPQYPGWYYDTIAQEWRPLDAYVSTVQSTVHDHGQQNQNGYVSSNIYPQNETSSYCEYRQAENFVSRGHGNQVQDHSLGGSYSSDNQKNLNMWQSEPMPNMGASTMFSGNQQLDNSYSSNCPANNDLQKPFSSFGAVPSYDGANQGHNEANGTLGYQSFNAELQTFNQTNVKLNDQMQFPNDYYGSQKPVNFAQQPFQSPNQFSYSPNVGRSSDGRPPHALVTFGFGGKLIVMKDNSNLGNSSFGSQNSVGGSVSVLNLQEVVTANGDASTSRSQDYLHALCQQSFLGPLVGGSVGSKELNKWIDERIANCESSNSDYRKAQILKLLLSLLKIACQHYGKLRSSFGSDAVLRENDTPESAVARLFASAKRNGAQFSEYGALSQCLQKLPSEGEIRATASEVQNLLVSGRKKEALQCAQEGQLWGPALVLASQLGDQFYVDTIKQMALRQLVAGSPLRTLCLLIAGQPAEVFSVDTTTDSNLPGGVLMPQQPTQFGAGNMLDDWEENLAVITANRTKDDELVIIHLGDCLWKERSEIAAAHICYLIAEANFESYSDSARLCLIGADHWRFPRTYASPEAIQRTELYEYSKVLGNSQFILLPFQPYKLIYAHMLAEVGKVSDSLKYCQAILKSLKTGRAPEVEMWKQLVLSLEERIKTHQQGGYATNLAPAKLVGKLLNFFDSTAHRVVGGLPPPAPSTSQGSVQVNEYFHQQIAHTVSSSQSTMAMPSLMPSASMEPISEWAADGNKMTMSNRSVSEPDFGRTPRRVDSSKEITSADAQGKASVSGGTSRFSRFGFGSQLLQKTVGLVLRPRPGKQAKLGEENKFYYDEKLKRWVEQGAELRTEEAALPPPPTTTAFQNGMSDYNLKSALKSEASLSDGSPDLKSTIPSDYSSGMPPIPPSSNQFSARGRMGVRSRYVDTFNQGGGRPANSFQSPTIPSKPAVAANAKFFIPTPTSGEQTMEAIAESVCEDVPTSIGDASTSAMNNVFQTPTPSSAVQRYPSMDNIPTQKATANGHGSLSSRSRRTASWSGSFSDSFSPSPKASEVKPLGEALCMSPSSFMPSDPSLRHAQMNGGNFVDDLQEVEL